ncbi:MAG TPA: PA14 domain-containing protein, partial [bacterium]|nr:PA14 domain-containing protein [bacterium]
TNPHGAWDMFATYGTWIGRGNQGAGHDKPFPYWIELLREYDAPIFWAGLLGTIAALWRRDRFGIFVVVWGWALWFVYSVIAYKTPWCNLNFTGPACILGGVLVREIVEAANRASRQAWTGTALAALAPSLVLLAPVPAGPVLGVEGKNPPTHVTWAKFMWDVNFVHNDDDRYKIIYVQTVRDFETLVERMTKILKVGDKPPKVWVTSGDYWPMPFYLRDWDGEVGYYQGKIPTDSTPASVVVSASTQDAELAEKLAGYRTEQFMLRPGVVLTMYVEPAIYDPLFGAPSAGTTTQVAAPPDSSLSPGLIADYRYGIGCTGDRLARRVDPIPSYGGYGATKEFPAPMCADWTGWIRLDETAEYAFTISSDDGSWIWLDGELVLPNGGTHGASERTSVLKEIPAGLHSLEVRYFDAGGGALLKVGLRKRGGAEMNLEHMLFHDKTAETAPSTAAPGLRAGP